jgi:large subunit ribosomal protein L21
MSYAVIKTGGKQYRVEEGQTLLVEKLAGDVGSRVDLETLLVAGDGDPSFEGTVSAEIVDHVKGPKLRVVKFKPKRGYKRRTGHRQQLTRIRIAAIDGSSAGAGRSRKKSEQAEVAKEASG